MRAEQLFDVSGRVAIVTGAASGIGLAMSDVLSANGAHVVMADIAKAQLDEAAESFRSEGRRVDARVLDVADLVAVDETIRAVAAQHGRLDTVFANAGITGGPGYTFPNGDMDHVSFELWDRVMQVNLTGAFATLRAAASVMKPRRRGSIVVTSSVAALRASHLPSHAYHASKAAIAQVVRVAALELGPHNVRVNAIAPGPFATGIGNGRLRSPEVAASFAATVPLGRVAQTEEIMGLALLLASDASSFMTGAIIPIDGGTQA
ncbi:SDR family NAD(P)-dependent oxidoreductase [Methylobacterium aquaticum]|uniref:Short-chain dehydrogenase n=1 Tax=Methylobacterium aquaticum TaxID=270351 RepID=A0A0J6SRV3_9HYPH|nr:SDR family NAD(P)-dependent oxidoreductase [Methylobacterium aquaticum]KMO36317.1 short-chain dehydrogenase [Methylobacterium aquaticum]